jgi:hypothetical protein
LVAQTLRYHCVDFQFTDGATGDKYLVQLNEPDEDEPYIFCKTTSQSKNKRSEPPCQPDRSLYALKARHDFFPLDTWLQLYELYRLPGDQVLQYTMSHRVQERGQLRLETIGAVVNCIRRCEDVSEADRALICRKP